MPLSAILTAAIAPFILAVAPIAMVQDYLSRDCTERAESRQMVKAKAGKADCRRLHFVLM